MGSYSPKAAAWSRSSTMAATLFRKQLPRFRFGYCNKQGKEKIVILDSNRKVNVGDSGGILTYRCGAQRVSTPRDDLDHHIHA